MCTAKWRMQPCRCGRHGKKDQPEDQEAEEIGAGLGGTGSGEEGLYGCFGEETIQPNQSQQPGRADTDVPRE